MRAPLRVALGGGGTDLPSYYREHGGLVVSTAIDRYVHMTVSARFARRFVLKHLEWEEVDHPREVRHPILRAALTAPLGRRARSSWPRSATRRPGPASGRPARTRCARSRRWPRCPAAARARRAGRGRLPPRDRAGRALDRQAGPVRGGLRRRARLQFRPDGGVDVRELSCRTGMRAALRDEFLLFFTGRAPLGVADPRRRPGRGGAAPAQAARRRDLRCARGRRPRPPGRADAGALGGQAPPRPPGRSRRRWTSCASARCAPAPAA